MLFKVFVVNFVTVLQISSLNRLFIVFYAEVVPAAVDYCSCSTDQECGLTV